MANCSDDPLVIRLKCLKVQEREAVRELKNAEENAQYARAVVEHIKAEKEKLELKLLGQQDLFD